MHIIYSTLKLLIPVYGIILLGYWFKRKNLYDKQVDSFLNTVAFYYILPVVILKGLLFNQLFVTINMVKMLAFLAAFFFLLYYLFTALKLDLSNLILSMRGNIVYFGIPILGVVLSENDFLKGTLFISVLSPVTITLVGFLDSNERGKIVKKIIRNPFLITLIAGMILRESGLSFEFFRFTMEKMTQSLFFISLMIVGGNLSFRQFSEFSLQEGVAMLVKLLLMPAVFFMYAHATGIDGISMKIGLILFSTPCAVTNLTIIRKLGLKSDHVAKNVMLTTFLYFLYLPALVVLLKSL